MDYDEQSGGMTVDKLRNTFATMSDTYTRDLPVVAVDDKGNVWRIQSVLVDDTYQEVRLSVEHDQSTAR